MAETAYKYSRRRRSIGLTVTVEGKVVVAAPAGATRAQIDRALERHQDWLTRKVAARKEALSRVQKGAAYYLGQPHRLRAAPGLPAGVDLSGKELRVRLPDKDTDPWPLLKAWYQGQAERLLAARVRLLATPMGLKPGPLMVRDWRGRWGECHLKRGLGFNWRLILLPLEVIDYVVVHELAHLKVPGHPPQFWRLVAEIMPDYASRRAWLNHYGAPFLQWRL
jgi:hypothetical protein